ncbi:MAG TPA: hypothetical protein PKM41_07600 [Deltaproteobacteria bacterium]|jgi:hypothetical protein|nr:hypothetical protein [Deltaproteobacteria bacterium]HOI06922.1 hypothetical protein [Deltaproteobacteria bacterium]
MTCRKSIPNSEDLLRAEKQVLAGMYGRLLARYIMRFGEHYASRLAVAVTKVVLSQTDSEEEARTFLEQNRDQVMTEVAALKDDRDLRRIVTDTLVLKAVFGHRTRGCSKDESMQSIQRLKDLGIYLEGTEPPTPAAFVRMASRFFSETPLRGPAPASCA